MKKLIILTLLAAWPVFQIGCTRNASPKNEAAVAGAANDRDDSTRPYQNLGWLGATASPAARSISLADPDHPGKTVSPGAVVIRDVLPGEPAAKAGLQTGDVVVRAGEQWLPIRDDSTLDLLEELESLITAGVEEPELGLLRDGQYTTVSLDHGLTSLDEGLPTEVRRIDQAARRAAVQLAAGQNEDGSFGEPQTTGENRLRTTALAGLALRSVPADDDRFAAPVERCLEFIATQLDHRSTAPPAPEQPESAPPGIVMVQAAEIDVDPLTAARVLQFLAESGVSMANRDWLGRITGLSGRLAKTQSAAGGWNVSQTEDDGVAATIDVTGTHTTNQVLLALGAWERKGLPGPPEVIARACGYLKDQAAARAAGGLDRRTRAALAAGTAAALVAIHCQATDLFYKDVVKEAIERAGDVFDSPVLGLPGLLSTALVARSTGKDNWIRFYHAVRIPLLQVLSPDGSFHVPTGKADGPGQDRYWQAAHYTLTLGMQQGLLRRMTGQIAGPVPLARNSSGESSAGTAAPASAAMPAGGRVMQLNLDDLSGEGSLQDQIREKLKEMGVEGDIRMNGESPGGGKKKKRDER